MAEISFDHVCKSFDKTAAVQDLSLQIADGEFLVLVGPSGCGKSTALRMVAGLEAITSGEIRIGGRIVNHLPPQSRDVAMIFQNYALYPHMTVRKNLAFPLKMMRLPKREIARRVEQTAELLELTPLLDRVPKQLSGGQRQRVAMGRAMVREPAVFLMDEPLSNLDAKLRVQIRAEIIALHRRLRTTTVYVTHDQVEAMTMGDRLAVLNHGRLQQVGTPQELYQSPANLFVATFIGSPSMNLFETTLERLPGQQIGFRFGQKSIPIQPGKPASPALESHIGERLIAGIRPEAFVPGDHVPVSQTFDATIFAIESLGHEQLVYFDAHVPAAITEVGGQSVFHSSRPNAVAMAARLSTTISLHLRENVSMGIDTQQLYFFTLQGVSLGAWV